MSVALISSRLVYGGILIFLGIRIAINPYSAPQKIAWGIGYVLLLATAGLLIGFITTKRFNRENRFLIMETLAFMLLGALMIIFDTAFGKVLQEAVFLLIIIVGIENLLCIRDLNNIRSRIDARNEKIHARQNRDEVTQSISEALQEDFEKYNGELIHAAGVVKKKVDASTWGQVILNEIILAYRGYREKKHIEGLAQDDADGKDIGTVSNANE